MMKIEINWQTKYEVSEIESSNFIFQLIILNNSTFLEKFLQDCFPISLVPVVLCPIEIQHEDRIHWQFQSTLVCCS